MDKIHNLKIVVRIQPMANTAQTRKRARQTVKQRAHNVGLRSTLRTAIKKIKSAIEGGNSKAAKKAFEENVSIDFSFSAGSFLLPFNR